MEWTIDIGSDLPSNPDPLSVTHSMLRDVDVRKKEGGRLVQDMHTIDHVEVVHHKRHDRRQNTEPRTIHYIPQNTAEPE